MELDAISVVCGDTSERWRWVDDQKDCFWRGDSGFDSDYINFDGARW